MGMMVYELENALSGLKVAPLRWNQRFKEFLKKMKTLTSVHYIFKSEDGVK